MPAPTPTGAQGLPAWRRAPGRWTCSIRRSRGRSTTTRESAPSGARHAKRTFRSAAERKNPTSVWGAFPEVSAGRPVTGGQMIIRSLKSLTLVLFFFVGANAQAQEGPEAFLRSFGQEAITQLTDTDRKSTRLNS